MTRRVGFALSAISTFILAAASIGAFAESHVRIVRLSSVEGKVQMDRGTGEGLERAILNTPIVEGTRIVTGSDGLAEVEFENQSALRLAGNSEVKFTQLLLNDGGDKVNQIEVVKGIVYLDSAAKGEDVYRVVAGGQTLVAHRDTLMRIDAASSQVQVAVFKGNVQLENQSQPVTVQKKETLSFDPANASGYTVAKSIDASPTDAWNKEREAYASTYAQNQGYGGPNRAYGLQDLNYYGDYFYAPGYGYVWQPFGFANSMIGWNPYSNGAWMFYPGMGYAWASVYPWGWLPYHYGSWSFINGKGWAWVPGNSYRGQWYANNFQTTPKVVKAPSGWKAATPPTTATTANASMPTVAVGKVGARPAYISGGRIPPDFGSVIAGHSLNANAAPHGFTNPHANNLPANRAAPDTSVAHHASSPHVFATPTPRAVSIPAEMAPSYGASAGVHTAGSAVGSGSHSSASASHSSASSSTASHK
ncbi:MAG: FecR family protein [Candidatus Korobacteraceae bacterium]